MAPDTGQRREDGRSRPRQPLAIEATSIRQAGSVYPHTPPALILAGRGQCIVAADCRLQHATSEPAPPRHEGAVHGSRPARRSPARAGRSVPRFARATAGASARNSSPSWRVRLATERTTRSSQRMSYGNEGMSLMWISAQTTAPPLSTARSAAGTSPRRRRRGSPRPVSPAAAVGAARPDRAELARERAAPSCRRGA